MASGSFKLIVYGILLGLLFLGLIRILAQSTNTTFTLELMGLGFLMMLSLVAFFGYTDGWGERVFFLVFVCCCFIFLSPRPLCVLVSFIFVSTKWARRRRRRKNEQARTRIFAELRRSCGVVTKKQGCEQTLFFRSLFRRVV